MKKWLLMAMVLMLVLTSTVAICDEPPHSMEITLGLEASYAWSVPPVVDLCENPTENQNQFSLKAKMMHFPDDKRLSVTAQIQNTDGTITLTGTNGEGIIAVTLSERVWFFDESDERTIKVLLPDDIEEALAGTYVSEDLVFIAGIVSK